MHKGMFIFQYVGDSHNELYMVKTNANYEDIFTMYGSFTSIAGDIHIFEYEPASNLRV